MEVAHALRKQKPRHIPNDVGLRVSRTKAAIVSFIITHGYRPKRFSSDPLESYLGTALANYIWTGSKSFDPGFRLTIAQMCPPRNAVRVNKFRILEWIKAHGSIPKDHELYIRYRCYCQPTSKMHDPVFVQRVRELQSRIGLVMGKQGPRVKTATHMTYRLLKGGCRDGVELMTQLLKAMRAGKIKPVSSVVCFAVVVKAALRVGLGFKTSRELVRAFPSLKVTAGRVLAIDDIWSGV